MTRGRGAVAGVALTLALALAGCGSMAESPDRAGGPPDTAIVAGDVMRALAADGRADVVVSLAPPAGYDDGAAADTVMRAAIARLQDDVLAALQPSDFRLRRRFESIPALAGTVLTGDGIRILAGHPRVVRVDLEVGGGGGGTP